MFDAYTVKKVLPRLVAAVILIQLSWFLFTGMIQLTTAISYGIEGLMAAPFGGADALTLSNIFVESGLGSGAAGVGLVTVVVAGGIAAGGITGLGVLIALAIFVGFLVLVLRRILLIALLILSPLAIVAWILPGTERFWKIWWDNFSKMLLMFPLILVMITAGKIFALLTAQGAGGEALGLIDMAIILVAYFAPFALIPLTYKAAGAGLGAIAGAVKKAPDSWAGAAKERGKKKAAERRGERANALKSGDFFKGRYGTSRFADRANAITRGAATGRKGGFGLGKRGEISTDNAVAARAEELKKLPSFAANSENDPVLQGAAAGRTYAESVKNLQSVFGYSEKRAKEIANQTRATMGFGAAQQMAASQQLVATGTGYSNVEQMQQVLALGSRGNSTSASRLAGNANATAKKVGRYDLAPGYGKLNETVHGTIGKSTAASPTNDTELTPQAVDNIIAGSRAGDPVTLLRGKTSELENIAEAINRKTGQQHAVLQNPESSDAARSEAQAELQRLSNQVGLLGRNADMGYASEGNAAVVQRLRATTGSVLPPANLAPIPNANDPNAVQPAAAPPDPGAGPFQ
jgi:hypothetical protein